MFTKKTLIHHIEIKSSLRKKILQLNQAHLVHEQELFVKNLDLALLQSDDFRLVSLAIEGTDIINIHTRSSVPNVGYLIPML